VLGKNKLNSWCDCIYSFYVSDHYLLDTQIKEPGKERKVLTLERIISDQAVKLEDLEFVVKQVINSEQTLAKTSEETIQQMQVSNCNVWFCVLFNLPDSLLFWREKLLAFATVKCLAM